MYKFPQHRLRTKLLDADKTPLVLVACGSFSPITHLHLRMFEMAGDFIKQNTDFELMGGYFSPVSDYYNKAGLLCAEHRVNMVRLACEQTSSWLMVDEWEPFQKAYVPTAQVLDHFYEQLQGCFAGGERKRLRVMLLAGADLLQTMSEPGVWDAADLQHILGRYGALIVERDGTDMEQALDSVSRWRNNIYILRQMVRNDISSTKIRLFIRRSMSVKYLLPACVDDYIQLNGLYRDEGDPHTRKCMTPGPSPLDQNGKGDGMVRSPSL